MRKTREFDFERCTSGIDFENWVKDLMTNLGFKADRVGKNDGGVDVVATETRFGMKYTFYIQCKYYNKPLGKAPIQEIFAGAARLENKGDPVVITNNSVSVEARIYANELGVEIISAPEWDEFEQIIKDKKVDNPNIHRGLFGFMIASYLNDYEYLKEVLRYDTDEEKFKSKRDLKLQVISDFDAAEEYVKEAAYLQQKASQYQQKALEIQKRAFIRNINYG